MNLITSRIIEAFNKSLPGEEAQHLMSPSVRFTGSKNPDRRKARESSVLILLFIKNGEWYIPFIQRPKYKGAHSGQVSLPGGKTEEEDKGFFSTAIRETEEEIGIDRSKVQFVGELTSLYIPNSNFMVYPQVGIYNDAPDFVLDKREVDSILEVPVSELTKPSNIKSFTRIINDVLVKAPFYAFETSEIWGATAMIISEFIQVIKTNALSPLLHSYSDCNAPICR